MACKMSELTTLPADDMGARAYLIAARKRLGECDWSALEACGRVVSDNPNRYRRNRAWAYMAEALYDNLPEDDQIAWPEVWVAVEGFCDTASVLDIDQLFALTVERGPRQIVGFQRPWGERLI